MKILNAVLGVIVGLLILLVVWGLIEPKFLDIQAHEADVPNLPAAWEGKTVGLLSDFQVGMWWDNTGTVEAAVEHLVEEQPALVLITGDFVYHAKDKTQQRIDEVLSLIGPLGDANIPVYAVLGNHDYAMDKRPGKGTPNPEVARQVEQALEAAGIQVLENEAVAVYPGGVPDSAAALWIAGIGSKWVDRSEPAVALDAVPAGAARIAFMHNPDSFENIEAGKAPLAFAGHTHGGQIRLPFLPDWSWLTFVEDDKVHTDGWSEGFGQPNNGLYVNRGIGFSNIPLRVNCMPELTLFTLRSTPSPDADVEDVTLN